LVAKGMTVGVPLASGILVTGLGLGLLNRFLTAYRFNKQQQETAATSAGSQAFPMAGQPFSKLPVNAPVYNFGANHPVFHRTGFTFPAGQAIGNPSRNPNVQQ
jgi:hypothetical protein